MLRNYAKFLGLQGAREARLYYGNFLVALHVRFTPNTSTGTVINESLLEQLRLLQRKNEFKCASLYDKMIEVGKEIDPDQTWVLKSEEIEELSNIRMEQYGTEEFTSRIKRGGR